MRTVHELFEFFKEDAEILHGQRIEFHADFDLVDVVAQVALVLLRSHIFPREFRIAGDAFETELYFLFDGTLVSGIPERLRKIAQFGDFLFERFFLQFRDREMFLRVFQFFLKLDDTRFRR